MTTATLEDVQTRLREIIDELTPGEELVIVRDGEPVATLTRNRRGKWPCKAVSAREMPHFMAADFDAPLEDFREYMQ